jgi:hypothetical protein
MTATPRQLISNNAATTLAGDITNVATTANLASGAGALMPNPGANQYFLLTFVDQATGLVNEIVKVTNMTGDTITTMVRGQEGTAALAWAAGSIAAVYVTAGTIENLAQPPDLLAQAGDFGVDTGTANAMVVTVSISGTNPVSLAAIKGAPMRLTKGASDNTGAVTLAWVGLGATPAVDSSGNPFTGGELISGVTYTFVYDGTHFVLQGGTSSGSSGRIILTGGMTFYVATTGNDANDGLSVGTPWLTLQHAWNVIFNKYDLAGFGVTITVANGTYANGVAASGRPPGADTIGAITFSSTSATPSACIINDAGSCFVANANAALSVSGFTVISGNDAFDASGGAQINHSNMIFGVAAEAHMFAWNGGRIYVEGNYTITGGADEHIDATRCGQIYYDNAVTGVTVTGTPAFASEFAVASDNGSIFVDSGSVAFTGAATGTRYIAKVNGTIDTQGGGANFFPGSSVGSVTNGGVYV